MKAAQSDPTIKKNTEASCAQKQIQAQKDQ